MVNLVADGKAPPAVGPAGAEPVFFQVLQGFENFAVAMPNDPGRARYEGSGEPARQSDPAIPSPVDPAPGGARNQLEPELVEGVTQALAREHEGPEGEENARRFRILDPGPASDLDPIPVPHFESLRRLAR